MATDADSGGEEHAADPLAEEGGEPTPFWVEVWNDYDPSMRFAAIFPLTIEENVTASTAAYYIIEPGNHTGLHSDNADEIVFVAEDEGDAFSIGQNRPLVAGQFYVFPAGVDHDRFLVQVEAAIANGASGVIAGRSLWKDCISLDRAVSKERLSTVAVSRLRDIQAVVRRYRPTVAPAS